MSVALIVALVVAFVVVMFVVVPGLTFRWIERSVAPRIAAVVPARSIVLQDLRANSLGLTSRGKYQSRGNGALVLTADELVFFQMVPKRDLTIPLATITEVKTVKVHLGKSYGRNLLYVGFDGPSRPDSIAWFVRDLPAWLAALKPSARGPRAIGDRRGG
jgi:hypothetical protein